LGIEINHIQQRMIDEGGFVDQHQGAVYGKMSELEFGVLLDNIRVNLSKIELILIDYNLVLHLKL
jgi:hypothetical protein